MYCPDGRRHKDGLQMRYSEHSERQGVWASLLKHKTHRASAAAPWGGMGYSGSRSQARPGGGAVLGGGGAAAAPWDQRQDALPFRTSPSQLHFARGELWALTVSQLRFCGGNAERLLHARLLGRWLSANSEHRPAGRPGGERREEAGAPPPVPPPSAGRRLMPSGRGCCSGSHGPEA